MSSDVKIGDQICKDSKLPYRASSALERTFIPKLRPQSHGIRHKPENDENNADSHSKPSPRPQVQAEAQQLIKKSKVSPSSSSDGKPVGNLPWGWRLRYSRMKAGGASPILGQGPNASADSQQSTPPTMQSQPQQHCSAPVRTSASSADQRNHPDFYSVLGVSRVATTAEIQKAFRRQCIQHHPDKGGDRTMFDAVSKANEILSDVDLRLAYDERGLQGVEEVQKGKQQVVGSVESILGLLEAQTAANGRPDMWCLCLSEIGDVAKNDYDARDWILQAGALGRLGALYQHARGLDWGTRERSQVFKTFTKCIKSLCCGRSPPPFEQLFLAFGFFVRPMLDGGSIELTEEVLEILKQLLSTALLLLTSNLTQNDRAAWAPFLLAAKSLQQVLQNPAQHNRQNELVEAISAFTTAAPKDEAIPNNEAACSSDTKSAPTEKENEGEDDDDAETEIYEDVEVEIDSDVEDLVEVRGLELVEARDGVVDPDPASLRGS